MTIEDFPVWLANVYSAACDLHLQDDTTCQSAPRAQTDVLFIKEWLYIRCLYVLTIQAFWPYFNLHIFRICFNNTFAKFSVRELQFLCNLRPLLVDTQRRKHSTGGGTATHPCKPKSTASSSHFHSNNPILQLCTDFLSFVILKSFIYLIYLSWLKLRKGGNVSVRIPAACRLFFLLSRILRSQNSTSCSSHIHIQTGKRPWRTATGHGIKLVKLSPCDSYCSTTNLGQ